MTQRNTDPKKHHFWHCKQLYQGLVSVDSGARSAPSTQNQGKQSWLQLGAAAVQRQ